MKTRRFATSSFLTLAAGTFLLGSGGVPADKDQVTLEKGIHFTTADAKDVLVPPGTYRVDFSGRKIGLSDAKGARTVVDALWGTHPAVLDGTLALAIPGDGDQADVEFVVLLMPGGTMLEASGTYSGVSRRGILDKIQNSKVGQFAQKAGAKVTEVATNVKETVVAAVPAAQMQQLVQGIQDPAIRDLLVCIASSDRQGPDLAQYIATYRDGGPAGFFRSVGEDIAERMESRFDVIMGKDIERIRKGQPLPSTAQIIDESFEKLELLMADRVATRCLYESIKPKLPELKTAILGLQQQAEQRRQKFFDEKIAPLVLERVTGPLMAAMEPDWTPFSKRVAQSRDVESVQERGLKDTIEALWNWDEHAMVGGLWTQVLAEQLASATTDLQKALQSQDPDAVRKAIATTETWSDQAKLKFGLAIMRYKGHELLDKIDDKLSDNKIFDPIDLMEMSADVSSKIISSVCGLVPEAGAAACAMLETPMRVLWNMMGRRAVKNLADKLVHAGWEGVCQAAEKKILTGQAPADPGPLRACLGAFTRERVLAVAAKNTPDTAATLKAYDDQLRALVTKWEQKK